MIRPMIRQRFSGDCQVCCLAMFLGVDYEAVVKHCWGNELVQGLADERRTHIASLFKVAIVDLDSRKISRRKPAVLAVPSLNHHDGSRHVVYWDGKRIHDPNQGVPGKKSYTNQQAWECAIDGYQRAPSRRSK